MANKYILSDIFNINLNEMNTKLLEYVGGVLTAMDIVYFTVLFYTSTTPCLSLFFAILFPGVNLPALKLSNRTGIPFIRYTLTLTLLPMFFVTYLSGPEAPGWLLCFSGVVASYLMIEQKLHRHLLVIAFVIIASIGSYLGGKNIVQVTIILVTLSSFTLIFTQIFSYIGHQNNQIVENGKRLNDANNDIKVKALIIDNKNKLITDSINYASLIQKALLPPNEKIAAFFCDSFIIWQPKDVVGGDIFLFETLRHKDECLLMVIDCTGHGVPGAFVTMLVKAVEQQIIGKILNRPDSEVSPAWILNFFNKTIKRLLKQEDSNCVSNTGFDGGILYYNRKKNYINFAGAGIPLFYSSDGRLQLIKGDRHSVGDKRSPNDIQFKEHRIDVTSGMAFYLTTDGYIDQCGGQKGFAFGKKKFCEVISEHESETMADQKEMLLYEMSYYQGEEEQRDDMTIVGLRI